MKKVRIAMFFAVVLVFVAVGNAFAERSVDDAVNWAEDQIDKTGWSELCLRFCANAYGFAHAGLDDAWAGWTTSSSAFGPKMTSDSDIPIGALVFYGTSLHPEGHVGIYVGNNEIVHAWTDKVRKDNIHDSKFQGDYEGWRWPSSWTEDAIPKPPSSQQITCQQFTTECPNLGQLIAQGDIPWEAIDNCLNVYNIFSLDHYFVIYSGWNQDEFEYQQMAVVVDYESESNPQVLGASINVGTSYLYEIEGGIDAIYPNPNADGDDVHITHHHIRPYNEGSWHEQVDIDLGPGQSFDLHTQARVENRSSHDLEDVDIDYCVVKDKKDFDIPHDERKRLDDDQVDIDEGEKENKTMARTRVSIAPDFKTIKVDALGRHNFTFPITQENINEREITLYFYIDVETESGDDRDVSDEMKTDEFGKLEIHLPYFDSRFIASSFEGEAPLAVDFTNQSAGSSGAISSYLWDFGDGYTSTETSPSYTYTTPGVYVITLTTTSSWGEEKTATTTIKVIEGQVPYVFSFAQTCEGIQDEGDYFYSSINVKSTFNQGEDISYLAKLENITVPHRLKLDIQHSNGWGWDETWDWEDPGSGWDYTFFQTVISDSEPGTYTLNFSITTDDANWTQLSQVQATVLNNGSPYQYVSAQTCESLIWHDDPLWEYETVNPKTTFHLGEDIYILTQIDNVSVDHRFKTEVYYDDDLWWANADGSTPFTEVSGTWGHSYDWLSQYAEFEGTFTFKIYLDIGQGYEYLDEIDVTVVP